MTYELECSIQALKEWNRLDASLREQFKKSSRNGSATPMFQLIDSRV